MSKVILYIAASLDGFIAGSDGDIAWLDKYGGGTEDYGYNEFYAKIGANVMGSGTYEKSLTLDGGIDSNMPTYVVTQRDLPVPPGTKVELYRGDLPVLIDNIRNATSKDIWLVGGGELARSFLEENLLDEIILSTIPVVLGGGISLFGSIHKTVDLTLIDSRAYPSGIVQTHYRR